MVFTFTYRTLNKQVKYEVLVDINVFSNNTVLHKNDKRHPPTSDYATLGEALAACAKDSNCASVEDKKCVK